MPAPPVLSTELPPNTQTGDAGMPPVTATVEAAVAKGSRAAPADAAPFTGSLLWIVGGLLALANFMAVLDTTITNVSVPTIAGGLAVSPSQGTWTITSYSVAEAITVPLTGWLAARFGTVTVFTTAMALFAVFSFACGFAPSLGVLVSCRVLQGLSGGPMIPLSQTLLLRVFPRHQASQALALWSMTTVVAPIAGPLLGGAICDNIGWRWIFYINVPIAIGVSLIVYRLLKPKETPGRPVRLDTVGLALLVVWISALQIMLDKGKELDWFASPVIVTLLIVAAIGFAAFLIWELTEAEPVVNLRVFRHRSFATACGVMAIAMGGFFSANVLLPLWLQTNLGYNATWAGRAGAFNGVLAIVFSPIVGRFGGRFDPRMLVTFGLFWMGGMMLLRTGFTIDVSFGQIIVPTLLQGMGIPFFFIPLMTLGTASLPPDETASGAGLISFVRTTSGAFAVSIVTTQWDEAADRARVDILNQGARLQEAADALQRSGLSVQQALGRVEGVVQQQAVMVATDHLFMAIAGVIFLAGCSIWLAPLPKRGAQPAVRAH